MWQKRCCTVTRCVMVNDVMANPVNDTIPADVVRRAAAWFARLQSAPADEALRRHCEQWRAQHPHHDLAWQRLQAIQSEMSAGFGRVARPQLLADTLVASTRGLDRRQALKLLSLVVVGGVVWSARDTTPWSRWSADYTTAIGERRSIELPDHSLLQLDTGSAVDLQFSDTERLLVLAHGGLRLTSGHDPQQRPLRVRTRLGTFEALGTVFTLRHEEGVTRLQVEEGEVAVVSNDRARQAIAAGQGCVVDRDGIGAAVADGMTASGWADGVIDTQSMRLGDFVAEVARYRRGYLGCDAAVADLRLSGVYRLDETDQLLDVVQRTLPVNIVYRTRWWVTVTARV